MCNFQKTANSHFILQKSPHKCSPYRMALCEGVSMGISIYFGTKWEFFFFTLLIVNNFLIDLGIIFKFW